MGHIGRAATVFRSVMTRHVIAVAACLGLILACAGGSPAQPGPTLQGVYAHVDLEQAIDEYLKTQHLSPMWSCFLPLGVSTSDLHKYLKTVLYKGLLNNSAVAGIKLGVHWCLIQPYRYDWSYLDDVFAAVAENNRGKTVQLSITPGFNSTTIGYGPITGSCDVLFWPPGHFPAPNCYYVTFSTFPEQQNANSIHLPLPWTSTYNTPWGTFLTDLGERINERPDYKAAMVAIVVAGPVGASTEMILPSSLNSTIFVTNDRTFGYYEDVDTGGS